MRSGEKLGGGEVESGERSRDEERGIGARVIEAQNELVGGATIYERARMKIRSGCVS